MTTSPSSRTMSAILPLIIFFRFTLIFISLPVRLSLRLITTLDFLAHSVGPPAWAMAWSRVIFFELR